MDASETLECIREAARLGRILIRQGHATDRMMERGVTADELQGALAQAILCVPAVPHRWEVHGPDFDGDNLIIICIYDPGDDVVVVTVF